MGSKGNEPPRELVYILLYYIVMDGAGGNGSMQSWGRINAH